MTTSSALGKRLRLERIIPPKQKVLLATLDDSLLAGPRGQLARPCRLLSKVIAAGAHSVLAFPGVFLRCPAARSGQYGRVVNVTASTTLGVHTRKTLVGTVDVALAMGADGIAVHINVSSAYEAEMLDILGRTARECDLSGLPLVAIAYPRTEAATTGDDNYEALYANDRPAYVALVRHTARLAVDLGADVVKTQYTGDAESFASVVEVCAPVPVLMAGGPLTGEEEILSRVSEVIAAGAAGVSIGRNIFLRDEPELFIRKVMERLS